MSQSHSTPQPQTFTDSEPSLGTYEGRGEMTTEKGEMIVSVRPEAPVLRSGTVTWHEPNYDFQPISIGYWSEGRWVEGPWQLRCPQAPDQGPASREWRETHDSG